MSRGISSANPDQLLRYSEISRELDANLRSTAGRLQAQLEHFEARCVEPGFRLHVSGCAATLQHYAVECETIDLRVFEVGQHFQAADRRWGKTNVQRLENWFSRAWNSLYARLSSILSRINSLVLIDVPDWLLKQVSSMSWTTSNYSEWMSDITAGIEFLSRYLAEKHKIEGAYFSLADIALFLFSKSEFCSEWLRDRLEDASDLKDAYGLIYKFSEANFSFFMAKVLANPERYIDPWLYHVNTKVTLFPNRPVGSGSGITNLQGRDMSEIPEWRWMRILFPLDEKLSRGDPPTNVLDVSTFYAAEMPHDSVEALTTSISKMPLFERWQWLENIQAEIEIHLQELADLRASGANEHLSAADLEQRIAILRERQTKLQSEADNWLNKVWISEQGLKPGFDDGRLDAPWRTRSDDLEDQITEIVDEIAEVEALLPHQRAYDRVVTELRMAENTKQRIETFLAENWWNDVPLISQQGLKYREYNTNYGCVPTATAMVLEYWHGRNPANKTMSAQELLDKNVAQGQFTANGMSPAEIHDEVQSLGYTHAPDKDVSFEKLKTIVTEGPVIAIVKMGMKTTGINHVVVVTGISPDGRYVRVIDPWSGQALTYTREEFMRSWGADFGSGYQSQYIMVIRPS